MGRWPALHRGARSARSRAGVRATPRGDYVNGVGCNVGISHGLKFYTPLVATHSYRVVVTARTDNGSSFPTRKFRIRTVWEPS